VIPGYREYALPPPLAAFVECVWFLRTERPAPDAGPDPIFPDGCLEAIVHLRSRARSSREGRPATLQPAAFLLAPAGAPLLLEPLGALETMGIRFRPGAAGPFLPCGVDALGSGEVALRDVFGRGAEVLAERLRDAASDEARVDLAGEFLLVRLATRRHLPEVSGSVREAVRRLLARPRVSIAELARTEGWSVRRLERRFLAETGLAPARLRRVIRFQRVFRAMSGPGADWVSVALDCGYADQPHLVREFREFTGSTPEAFRTAPPVLASAFVARDRLDRFFGA
jgi:AraC-like DNA-binding protein